MGYKWGSFGQQTAFGLRSLEVVSDNSGFELPVDVYSHVDYARVQVNSLSVAYPISNSKLIFTGRSVEDTLRPLQANL